MEAPNLLLVNSNQANRNGLFVFLSVCDSVDMSHVHHLTSILCHETSVDNCKGIFHFLVGHFLATLQLHMIHFYQDSVSVAWRLKEPVGTGGSIYARRFETCNCIAVQQVGKLTISCFLLERQLLTPPKFNSSPLKSYPPKRKVAFNNHRFSGAMLNFRCVLYLIWGSFIYESRLVMTDVFVCLFVSLQEQLIHFRGRMKLPAFWWSKDCTSSESRLHLGLSYCLRYL